MKIKSVQQDNQRENGGAERHVELWNSSHINRPHATLLGAFQHFENKTLRKICRRSHPNTPPTPTQTNTDGKLRQIWPKMRESDSGLEICHSETSSLGVWLQESDLAGLIVFQPLQSITVVIFTFAFSVLLN